MAGDAEAHLKRAVAERMWLMGKCPIEHVESTDGRFEEWQAFAVLTRSGECNTYLEKDSVSEQIEEGGIKVVPAHSPLGETLRQQAPHDDLPVYASYVGPHDESVDGDWVVYED